MRKNFGAKPWTYPQPVFILATYGEDGTPDAMNAAWGGISDDKELSMCISAGHKTTANILTRKAFTVSMATADQMVACDYVGIESGNKVANKLEKAGWHTTKSEFVDAPLIDELPMAVECRLVSYDPESCRLVGEIVNVSADECVLDADGCAGREGGQRLPGRSKAEIRIRQAPQAEQKRRRETGLPPPFCLQCAVLPPPAAGLVRRIEKCSKAISGHP